MSRSSDPSGSKSLFIILHYQGRHKTCSSKKENMELTWTESEFSFFFSNIADVWRYICPWDPCIIMFLFSLFTSSSASHTFHESSLIGYHTTIKKWDLVKSRGRYTSCSAFSVGKRALSPEIKRINGRLIKESGEVERGDL